MTDRSVFLKQVPNLVTLSRLIVLGAVIWLAAADGPGSSVWAFLLVLYGTVSDYLDGLLARRLGLESDLGKILDAMVDKIMVIGLSIVLLWLEVLPLWMIPVVGIVGIREFGISFLRARALKRGIVLGADSWGKRKTMWQTVALTVLFAAHMFRELESQSNRVDLNVVGYLTVFGMVCYLYSAGLSIVSGYRYTRSYLGLLATKRS